MIQSMWNDAHFPGRGAVEYYTVQQTVFNLSLSFYERSELGYRQLSELLLSQA